MTIPMKGVSTIQVTSWKPKNELLMGASCNNPTTSFRRKPESSFSEPFWTPASAGVTGFSSFEKGSWLYQRFRDPEWLHLRDVLDQRRDAYLHQIQHEGRIEADD